MKLPQSEGLNIASLSRLFDNKSECYKLFWFQAILEYVSKGNAEICFEDLIDEMIADAWYMVTEYHLNLGPRDNLEKLVHYIADTTGMQPNTRKKEILNWLKSCEDPIVIRKKNDLITNVPFRLQSPFIENFRSKMLDCAPNRQVLLINQQKRMIYYFGAFAGLNTHIIIVPEWMEYLRDNQEILRGWVQYNMIIYLQRRNPSVPGISDKLYPRRSESWIRSKSIGD